MAGLRSASVMVVRGQDGLLFISAFWEYPVILQFCRSWLPEFSRCRWSPPSAHSSPHLSCCHSFILRPVKKDMPAHALASQIRRSLRRRFSQALTACPSIECVCSCMFSQSVRWVQPVESSLLAPHWKDNLLTEEKTKMRGVLTSGTW